MITAGWPLRGGRGKKYKNTKKIRRIIAEGLCYLVERRKHICSAPGWLNLSIASCLRVPVIP